MAIKRSLSDITSKRASSEDELAPSDKPKVNAGIDQDSNMFMITLPLMVAEDDVTVSDGKKQDGTIFDKANVCYQFAAKDLSIGIRMNDGTTRYHKVKNNAGPYGATRYISLGFDPTVYFTRPEEHTTPTELDESVPMMATTS